MAAATILLLGMCALTACSGGTSPGPDGAAVATGPATDNPDWLGTPTPSAAPTAAATTPVGTAADKAAVASITVTGASGAKPTVTLPSQPFSVTGAVARTVDPGSGNTVVKGDLVTLQILELSGVNGGELQSTWSQGAPTVSLVDPSALNQQIYNELITARVGARLLVAAPQSDSDTGLTMTVIDVVDVIAAQSVPARATGTAVAPKAGLPAVALDGTGKPSLSAPSGTAPTDLVIQPLIQGSGPAVKSGQTIVVNYTGWLWNGTQFDSSWDRGAPYVVPGIGNGNVIDGWDEGLVGQQVGSQVLLIVPPDKGYGDTAQGTSIPANSTLVFVVDILAAV
ncbi:MAG: FKBP-type peptidyl-prolyl cis-trans isomerase [Micrococcales bacterium]|nr:FKBP-type peptidyl-prolyl cis-trans isomerase [Micrococcales bacterium]